MDAVRVAEAPGFDPQDNGLTNESEVLESMVWKTAVQRTR
jgi:hypothetical protein